MTAGDDPRPDGRAVRWQRHNAERRAELVDSTLRAIRRHGSGVSMDDIAAEAKTSKTVIYRHFTDRAGLYRAVADKVGRRIGSSLQEAIGEQSTALRPVLEAVIDTYLALTEADPEVYRFVVSPPALEGPVADQEVHGITDRAADILAEWFAAEVGVRRAAVWSVAVVGSVRACADQWLADPDSRPREVLAELLAGLAWPGLSGAQG